MNGQIVDISRLLDITDGDAAEMREFVDLYLQQTKVQIEALEEAIHQHSAGKVKEIAHTGAGSSATCGATTLAPLFRELETCGRNNDLSGVQDLLQNIKTDFVRVETFFQSYFSNSAK